MDTNNAAESLDTIYQLSTLLQTNFDKESLAIIIGLAELGVSPTSLSAALEEIERETSQLQNIQ